MTGSIVTRPVTAMQLGPWTIWPPILQAPMAGFTNLAYRQLLRGWGGVGLVFTEMVSARGFHWLEQRADLPARLEGIESEPRPLGVQIWDNDPELLARVGRCLAREHNVSVVDINFGCPVSRVALKAHSGSYLLHEPSRVGRIVKRVVAACAPTPVTAKIRLGPDRSKITALEVARAVASAGGAALTVHGRTAADFFRGEADWQAIAEIKARVPGLTVIGNGDLQTPAQAVEAWCRYGLDGLMVGRALLHRPWLARQMAAALEGRPLPPTPTAEQERAAVLRHFELLLEQFGPHKGTMLMRKFACCYAQGRYGARHFRTQAATVRTPEEFRAVLEQFFPKDVG